MGRLQAQYSEIKTQPQMYFIRRMTAAATTIIPNITEYKFPRPRASTRSILLSSTLPRAVFILLTSLANTALCQLSVSLCNLRQRSYSFLPRRNLLSASAKETAISCRLTNATKLETFSSNDFEKLKSVSFISCVRSPPTVVCHLWPYPRLPHSTPVV
jgi:hypothetical protein